VYADGMTAKVFISGDKKGGFIWQLVEDGKVLKCGPADTQAKAVIAGQDALVEHKRKRRWDRPWSASATARPDKKTSRNDT
jgi:hypothetical protein